MHAKDEKPVADEAAKTPPPARRFPSTLPQAKPEPAGETSSDLDLDLGDIQSRLPYGSEDIADK